MKKENVLKMLQDELGNARGTDIFNKVLDSEFLTRYIKARTKFFDFNETKADKNLNSILNVLLDSGNTDENGNVCNIKVEDSPAFKFRLIKDRLNREVIVNG